MTNEPLRILIVDDNPQIVGQLQTQLEDDLEDLDLQIIHTVDFADGEAMLKERGFDLAILDVKRDGSEEEEDEEAGRTLFQRVSEAQWLPVIFFTALPDAVLEFENPPLVQVANKTQILEIPHMVREALASGVPQFARSVAAGMETVTRRFLRQSVAGYWSEMSESEREDVLPLLANRLSFYLRNGFLDEVHLEGAGSSPYDHPSSGRYYLFPPVTARPTTGDLFRNGDDWWVLVTPQCDMVVRAEGESMKAEFLRFVRALPPQDTSLGALFMAASNRDARRSADNRVKEVFRDHFRYFYLPAFLTIPHLFVDFEQIRTVSRKEVLPPIIVDEADDAPAGETPTGQESGWQKIATIDSPYAEAMLYRLSRAVSRVGIEDIPPEPVLQILTSLRAESTQDDQPT